MVLGLDNGNPTVLRDWSDATGSLPDHTCKIAKTFCEHFSDLALWSAQAAHIAVLVGADSPRGRPLRR